MKSFRVEDWRKVLDGPPQARPDLSDADGALPRAPLLNPRTFKSVEEIQAAVAGCRLTASGKVTVSILSPETLRAREVMKGSVSKL